MTTYKFCVASNKKIICYKKNNGFIKFSGDYATKLLEHIKDFSFYSYNIKITKNKNDKYTYDLTFYSNNHNVIFEDVNTLKRTDYILIEKNIKDLITIIKVNNNIKKANELKSIRKNKQELLKNKLKKLMCATTISTAVIISHKENVKANINDELLYSNSTTQEYSNQILTKETGIIHNGPSGGDESFYDLKMDKVIATMRENGFDEINYPYWIREDGVKMLGNYVIVAANLQIHPRGSIVQTSLGTGLVCDTGDFAKTNKLKLDIATSWKSGA